MSNDKMRDDFETWAMVEGEYAYANLKRNSIGVYDHCGSDYDWMIWQAACASRDAEVNALRVEAANSTMIERILTRENRMFSQAAAGHRVILLDHKSQIEKLQAKLKSKGKSK
jgi:hypothetical protein